MCLTECYHSTPPLPPKVCNVPVPPRQVMGLDQENHSDEKLLLSQRNSSCKEKCVHDIQLLYTHVCIHKVQGSNIMTVLLAPTIYIVLLLYTCCIARFRVQLLAAFMLIYRIISKIQFIAFPGRGRSGIVRQGRQSDWFNVR